MRATLAAMRHRGPHAQAHTTHELPGGRVAQLLHARLSIIDLREVAHQPMRHGAHTLAFNGELYNYRELAEANDWDLSTSSDTEVFLRLLADRGVEALDDAEGMWALAWVDGETGTVTLARDRFAEKPLYVYEAHGGFYFASEIKCLATLSGERLEIDRERLQHYLVYGYRPLHRTQSQTSFFRGVRDVAPGSLLRIGADGAVSTPRYWSPTSEPDEAMSREEAVAAVRDAVIRSVELRLRSDVPVAFLMSSGVDSNAMIACASRIHGQSVRAFTIVNDDPRYDEFEVTERSARELGVDLVPVRLETNDFLDRLDGLVRHHDAPVYTISSYAQWLLMRAVASDGFTVAISGTGGDELFSGYYHHYNAYLAEMRGDDSAYAAALAAWKQWVAPIVRNPILADPEVYEKDPFESRNLYLGCEEFASWMCTSRPAAMIEVKYTPSRLRNRMLNELFHEAIPQILHEEDLNAMRHSIENRSPMLDRTLFETCQSIPDRHLMRDGYGKSVLRDAMRGIVPDLVLDERRKVGFNAPIHALLDHRDAAVRDRVLSESPIFDIVRRDSIAAILDEDELPNSRSKFLFSFLSARAFMDAFDA